VRNKITIHKWWVKSYLIIEFGFSTTGFRFAAIVTGFVFASIEDNIFYFIFLFLFNLAAGVSMAVPSHKSWGALIGLGIISQLGGYLALTYALGHLPATITSISLLLQVPITALMAVPLLKEPLSRAQVLGGLFVLAGVGLANRRNRPAAEANATLCEASEHE